MSEHNPNDQRAFEAAMDSLRAQVANVGAHAVIDSEARKRYAQLINEMADDLRQQARLGRITWADAAREASDIRNTIMDTIRGRSTPIGRAMAEKLKPQGRTLNELIARKAVQLHGPRTNFHQLTATQKNLVYAEIVRSAGRSNPNVTSRLRNISRAGRGLLFLSIAISVYIILVSDNPAATAKREGVVTTVGIGGGITGGALAGLACGPGAPVCVAAGAFIGGAMAAFGVAFLF